MPMVGSSNVAAPTMVMPRPCPTIDSNVPRPASKRRIDGADQRSGNDMIVNLRPVPP